MYFENFLREPLSQLLTTHNALDCTYSTEYLRGENTATDILTGLDNTFT